MRLPLIFALMLAAMTAQARPLELELPPKQAACWERSYDAVHLASHPRQKLAKIRLLHSPEIWQPGEGGSVYVMLYINLRERVKPAQGFDYQLSGFCRAAGQGLHCVPEWEAGSWRIGRGPNGTLDIRNAGIIANPNPYDAEEVADGAVRIPARPDDGTWRLSPASGKCELE
ncbi:hypothetical protein [Bosea sp. (in: a-proteobacteria)]|uniref:hypothetical protein n=1 Tax=Bosea sp. (in: a-proteobacteria) TaxID=1871050 RepID=UPI002FC97A17